MQTVQKATLGRFLSFGISICFLTSLNSCNEDNGTLVEINLLYKNSSTKTITVSHYSRNDKSIDAKVSQTLTIESGGIKSFYFTKTESGDNDNSIEDFDNFIIGNRLYDSAYLLFDQEKFIVFSKGEINTDIFFLKNYQGSEIKENKFEFTYEFTEEDYDNANEIGG